jgi:hypothetical protein
MCRKWISGDHFGVMFRLHRFFECFEKQVFGFWEVCRFYRIVILSRGLSW